MTIRVLVLDDDPAMGSFYRRVLASDGIEVKALGSGAGVLAEAKAFAPDVVLSDLLMPGDDGLAICRRLKADPETHAIPVVLISAKDFPADKRAALDAGAVAYIVKPPDPGELRALVKSLAAGRARVEVWGCRGSVPTPEHGTGLYGGNTSCVAVFPPGGRPIILDAGTGIRQLGRRAPFPPPADVHVCLTHFHWDHIQGLPFFAPLYQPENRLAVYGPAESDEELAAIVGGHFGREYFPAAVEFLPAALSYVALREQAIEIAGLPVSTLYAMHPGRTLAYRIELGSGAVVYAPDNEITPESTVPELTGEARRLADFAAGAKLLIHDCTFSRRAYEAHRGWGHSCGPALAAVAAQAGVEQVVLFHHDPDNDDDDVAAVHDEFRTALAGAKVDSQPAREGLQIHL